MSMTKTVLAEMEAVAERIRQATTPPPPPPPYVFKHTERWNAHLLKLPRTCRLWKQFLAFERARADYEAEKEKHDRWVAERRQIGHRLHHTDPDTEPGETFGVNYWRSEQLKYAIERQAEGLANLKTKAERAEEVWVQQWEEYVALHDQHTVLVAQMQRKQMSPGSYHPAQEEIWRLKADLRQLEGA